MKDLTVYLYTLPGCPRCNVLKKKLAEKNINVSEISDMEYIKELGIDDFPVMETVNGIRYNFSEAIYWLKNQGEG